MKTTQLNWIINKVEDEKIKKEEEKVLLKEPIKCGKTADYCTYSTHTPTKEGNQTEQLARHSKASWRRIQLNEFQLNDPPATVIWIHLQHKQAQEFINYEESE